MDLSEALELAEVIAGEFDGTRGATAFSANGSLSPAFLPKVAVGVSQGKFTSEARVAIRAWTEAELLLARAMIIDGFDLTESELDELVTGEIYAAHPFPPPSSAHLRTQQRPVCPGVSIGHVNVTAGTLAALVEMPDGASRMLSNNHIFANSVSVVAPLAAKAGDDILQQAPSDSGKLPGVGTLDNWIELRQRGNIVDAALAHCATTVDFEPSIPGIGRVSGMLSGDPALGLAVQKVGRTTGYTRGTVRARLVRRLSVRYGVNVFRFDRVIEVINPGGPTFSEPGDSGALVVDLDGNAVGLLVSGNEDAGVTYINPIHEVQQALGFSRIL
jgi:hypothetical protein